LEYRRCAWCAASGQKVTDLRPATLQEIDMFLVPVARRGSDLSRLFDETFDRFFQASGAPGPVDATSPALDVTETDKGWTVQLDLPGVSKEDVKVSIDGRLVSIEAPVRRAEPPVEGRRVLLRERQITRYARSLTLPAEVDQGASSARMADGVLELALARRGATAAAQLTIN
jgi:HSP20 family protein